MKKFLMGLSILLIMLLGLSTVSFSSVYWWPVGDLDVVSVESADYVQRIQVDNGTTVINKWLEIDDAADVNQILAVALTAQSNGFKVNLSFVYVDGLWKVNGMRIVSP